MIDHNKKLSQFIKNAQAAAIHAESPQDLLDVLEEAKVFKGNFNYNNRDILMYLGIDLGVIALSFLFLYLFDHGFWLITLILSIIAIYPIIKLFFSRKKNIQGLADDIFWKDLYFDNNLENSNDSHYDISALKQRYQDFHRGNYSQSIQQLLSSHYHNEDQKVHFHYFNFHYINERTVEKKDSDGKVTYEKVYDHFDRYGIVVPYAIAENVTIKHNPKLMGHNKSDYEPASLNFRKLFKVQTQDIFQASKFLTPVMVEYFENLPNQLQDIVIEFKEDEFLLSFTDNNVIFAEREYGFKHLDHFIQEIEKTDQLPKLKTLHSICNQFIRATENSFN